MKNGRLYVTLSSDGFARKCTVHSLVAAAFLGDNPPNHEITHQDGDYTNNAARNLEYVTRRENQKRFGRAPAGTRAESALGRALHRGWNATGSVGECEELSAQGW